MVVKMLRLAPLVLAIAAIGAQAQTTGESPFTFSGFATVGVVRTNTDDAQYVLFGQTRGADKSASGEVDSKLGLQLTGKANNVFSGTAQVLVKQTGDGNFRPELEWAFAKAQVTPSLGFRVGRMGGPFFAVSDFRDVGYANTWLRPPQDVYGQVPVSHFDGADAIYQTNVGSASVSAQLFGGQSKANVQGTDVKLDSLVGLNASVELDGGLTLRAGYLQSKLTVESASLATLVATLRATPFASVGNQLDPTKKKATFSGVGLAYDQGNWVANMEYTMRRTESYIPDTDGWYATLGYRFGKVLPYATVSKLKQKDSNVVNTIPGSTPQLAQLKAVVDGTLASQARNQKTNAVGVRWDAYRNVALKAQYERITPNGPGLFIGTVPGFGTTGGSVNVISLAVDTVF